MFDVNKTLNEVELIHGRIIFKIKILLDHSQGIVRSNPYGPNFSLQLLSKRFLQDNPWNKKKYNSQIFENAYLVYFLFDINKTLYDVELT